MVGVSQSFHGLAFPAYTSLRHEDSTSWDSPCSISSDGNAGIPPKIKGGTLTLRFVHGHGQIIRARAWEARLGLGLE